MRKSTLQVHVDADMLETLRKLSAETEVSISAHVRRAIRAYFDAIDN